MFRLDSKAALVTGASGGIGAAIARSLHAQGALVALSGTRRDALEDLAAQLGQRAFVCPIDLRDAAGADSLVAAAEQATGPLTILINNAGVTHDMLALRMSDEDWRSVIDLDLGAPFRLAGAALRGMVRRRAGRIISISSIVADRQRRPGQLCRREGRPRRHDQVPGAGSCLPRHHGECRCAWVHRHTDDRQAARTAAQQVG
jgi:3-oxoacyl-[acyl-carrier protein] reductase